MTGYHHEDRGWGGSPVAYITSNGGEIFQPQGLNEESSKAGVNVKVGKLIEEAEEQLLPLLILTENVHKKELVPNVLKKIEMVSLKALFLQNLNSCNS